MMYKYSISQLPLPILELLSVYGNIHNHNTRSGSFLNTPLCRSEASYRTFSYQVSHIGNHISQKVRTDVS